ncbi:hypothetical protein F9C11_35590 [Amycolatopsis sp. VS8301801F10]|uniref:hypothetical protein n=1 Tax=Amycolatopsis sp. VS8301801F10 TaxID=2652442 RepID=UPI0038FD1815
MALMACLVFSLTSCGNGDKVESPLSFDQAREVALNSVHAAAAAVFPAGYKLADDYVPQLPCTDASDRPTGQVHASVSFWVEGLDHARNNAYFDALARWWTSNGWNLETDDRPKDLFVNARRDGYLMGMQATPDGRLNLGVDSPCAWPQSAPSSEPKP